MSRAAAIAVSLGLLGGCATPSAIVTRVPVPVACAEPVPQRPAMPTETLRPGVDIFVFTKNAQAEIVLRDAYEVRLLTALQACRAPVRNPESNVAR